MIFGRNKKNDSWLAESVRQFGERNFVTGRAEIVDKELFANETVRIKALTVGYSRDVIKTASFAGALGANVTAYSIPDSIKPDYGSSPHSIYFFIRLRGGSIGMHDMHSMHM